MVNEESMKEIIMIDDNIELVREDLKHYAKGARETIQDLLRKKKKLREDLNQLPLFQRPSV